MREDCKFRMVCICPSLCGMYYVQIQLYLCNPKEGIPHACGMLLLSVMMVMHDA